MRKYVLDANCYIDASRDGEALTQLTRFSSWSAPGLFLSSVVGSELRAGAGSSKDRKKLEEGILGPFVRRGRVVTPNAAAWDAPGVDARNPTGKGRTPTGSGTSQLRL